MIWSSNPRKSQKLVPSCDESVSPLPICRRWGGLGLLMMLSLWWSHWDQGRKWIARGFVGFFTMASKAHLLSISGWWRDFSTLLLIWMISSEIFVVYAWRFVASIYSGVVYFRNVFFFYAIVVWGSPQLQGGSIRKSRFLRVQILTRSFLLFLLIFSESQNALFCFFVFVQAKSQDPRTSYEGLAKRSQWRGRRLLYQTVFFVIPISFSSSVLCIVFKNLNSEVFFIIFTHWKLF